MKERTRNLAVGLTVLVALAMLAGMVLLFTGLPELFQRGRVLRIAFNQSHDVYPGDWVHLAGLRVGKVTDITFRDGDARKGVVFTVRIDEGVNVPADVEPRVYTRGFVGGAYLVLAGGGPERLDPQTGRKLQFLPDDWAEPLEGVHKGTGLFPDELTEGLKSLSRLAENLNELIAPPATAPATAAAATMPATRPAAVPAGGLRDALAKLGRALEALDAVLGDAENQANLRKSLANLTVATEKASGAMDALKGFASEAGKTAGEVRQTLAQAGQTMQRASTAVGKLGEFADHADRRVEELSRKLIDDAEKLSAVLATVNRAATKLEAGDGTAGRLLNDPKLYQSLLDASDQLAALLKDLRTLVDQWKKSGVSLNVK